ncbi:hypothetical protein DER29_4310 [Micromonospora sp. M71_S20]|uniref:hypothetical protein n=1 Tax=Micromonospora sp. M71_S20 TaxID=592872 RepID=UPI000EAE448D|nr:hypothetical protein [Micromonospora sp. M71_S20]RLK13293.1 hypothetical protein DER29_4310 [Micromonospora sp. M71_S20]
MAALTAALAIAVVLLLIALAAAALLAYGYATALAATTAERDEARDDLHTAHREERRLRAELEQRAVAAAVLTPDAERPWPLWGYRTLRDIHTARSAADFDRKDQR